MVWDFKVVVDLLEAEDLTEQVAALQVFGFKYAQAHGVGQRRGGW